MSVCFPAAHIAASAPWPDLFRPGASAEMMEVDSACGMATVDVRRGRMRPPAILAIWRSTRWSRCGRNFARDMERGSIWRPAGRGLRRPICTSSAPSGQSGANVVRHCADDPDGGAGGARGAGSSFAALARCEMNLGALSSDGEGGTWAMICFGGNCGWVSTAYLTAGQPPC